MTGRRELLALYARHYNPALARMFDAAECPVEAGGEGCTLYDEEGRGYLDFAGGYGVFAVGHDHPRVRAAAELQFRRLPTAPPCFPSAPAARLTVRLAALLPGDLDRVYLAGSGSEAVEIALRTALLARPGRHVLVAAKNSYHGKTLGVLGLLGQEHLRRPFEPLLPEVRFVPYGDPAALADAVDGDVAAVFLEPVLGGGFITVPPVGYLRGAREVCDRSGALLVVDEVQTGFGRTGAMFGIDHDGVLPDLVVLSKGITGGHVALSATVVREEVLAAAGEVCASALLAPGADWAGTPLACAVAGAALDVIEEEELPRRAAVLGPRLQAGLAEAGAAYPSVAVDAPGRGLMVGLRVRNSFVEHALWLQMLKRGVVCGLTMNPRATRPVLRFFPPLIVEEDEIDAAVAACRASLAELSRVPAAVWDAANLALRFQDHLPPWLLRFGSRVMRGPAPAPAPAAPRRRPRTGRAAAA